MDKLKAIKKQNKESKERTVVNQHKVDWYNTMKTQIKREKVLEAELLQFVESNSNLKVASDSDAMTRRVRSAIVAHDEAWSQRSKVFEIPESASELLALTEDTEPTRNDDDEFESDSRRSTLTSKRASDLEIFRRTQLATGPTFDPERDEVFDIRDLVDEI